MSRCRATWPAAMPPLMKTQEGFSWRETFCVRAGSRQAASQFLNPVSINLKKLPQIPASRFLKIVKKPAKFQSAVSMCQFLSPGTLLYLRVSDYVSVCYFSVLVRY